MNTRFPTEPFFEPETNYIATLDCARLLKELEPAERLVLVGRFWFGLTYGELSKFLAFAEAHGIPIRKSKPYKLRAFSTELKKEIRSLLASGMKPIRVAEKCAVSRQYVSTVQHYQL